MTIDSRHISLSNAMNHLNYLSNKLNNFLLRVLLPCNYISNNSKITTLKQRHINIFHIYTFFIIQSITINIVNFVIICVAIVITFGIIYIFILYFLVFLFYINYSSLLLLFLLLLFFLLDNLIISVINTFSSGFQYILCIFLLVYTLKQKSPYLIRTYNVKC